MDLEYYTIEQAARALECPPDEIEHLLETDKLKAHLFSNSKKFIVIEQTPKFTMGRGIATYYGLISIHPSYTHQLLQNKKITINSRVVISKPAAITHWETEHQFKSEEFLDFLKITDWNTYSSDFAKSQTRLLAMPLPGESPGLMKMFVTAINSIPQKNKLPEESAPEMPQFPDHSYSFWKHGEFDLQSLRVTHEEIQKIREGLTSSVTRAITQVADKGSQVTPPNSTAERDRVNELHEVLIRLIRDHPELSARKMWNLLKAESLSVTKTYDLDAIIDEVTSDKIIWISRHGNQSVLAQSSFASTVSQLKKQLRDNQSPPNN